MTRLPPSDDYGAAIQFLYSRINYEQYPPVSYRPRKLNLDHMRRLLRRLGDPHLAVPVIHIAGTKGKGSTATMISSVLTQAGYRTGLYTSPHLEHLEERYVIDGQPCSPSELVALTDSVRAAVDEVDREIRSESASTELTFFEITTGMAFRYFAECEAEVAVLEVGMGGRLDSTNVCAPVLSIITSISFDHTRQLGSTLASIAREKAGIIKPGIPVVSGVEQAEPRNVIIQIAGERGSPLYSIDEHFHVEIPLNGPSSMSYRERMEDCDWRLGDIRIGLLGRHQARNAAVTLATLRRLEQMGWSIDEGALRRGLKHVHCPARIEVVRREPIVIVDTAHNVASVQSLVETLQEHFPGRQRTLIFAASRDKDVSGMLQLLLPCFDEILLTRFVNNPRAVATEELTHIVCKLAEFDPPPDGMPTIREFDHPLAAWEYCQANLSAMNLVCVTGSFFLAAELRSQLLATCETIHARS